MTELNTMSVHALSERVEELQQQLAAAEAIIEGERDRAKEREIEYHEQRRMREDAEAELERVRSALRILWRDATNSDYAGNADGEITGRFVSHDWLDKLDAIATPAKLTFDQFFELAKEHNITGEYLVSELRKREQPAPATEPVTPDTQDAARWRALLGAGRIRPIGSAGLSRPEAANYAHLGLELWTVFSRNYSAELLEKLDQENELGRKWLTEFADIAIAAQGLQPAPVAQSEQSQEGEQ